MQLSARSPATFAHFGECSVGVLAHLLILSDSPGLSSSFDSGEPRWSMPDREQDEQGNWKYLGLQFSITALPRSRT